MKAERPTPTPQPRPRVPPRAFHELLHPARGLAGPRPQPAAGLAGPERLRAARDGMHREAARLEGLRTEGQVLHGERGAVRADALQVQQRAATDAQWGERLLERLCLPERDGPTLPVAEAPARPGLPSGASAAREAAPAPTTGATRAEAVRALVERVEVFLRGSRPVLALTLASGPFASVAVERTAPGEVALRLSGRGGGAPPAETLAALRAGLTARGLRVRALQVAAPEDGG